MEAEKQTSKILIVEDEKDKRDGLVRILMYDGGWHADLIKDVATSLEAVESISSFEPDVVILDLKIPRASKEEPKISNAAEVLKEIELYNQNNLNSIYVIVISASVEDTGLRDLIKEDRSKILTFIDKNEAAIDSAKFKEKLLRQVHKALKKEREEKRVDYSTIRKSEIKKLQDLNRSLWEKIDRNILTEFELLFGKNANVHPRAKQIIGSCGEVVEDIISLLKDGSHEISSKKYQDENPTVGKNLYGLTGRSRDLKTRVISLTGKEPVISRAAAEFAYQAYRYRSEVLHSTHDDPENKKIFREKKLTAEDAAVSVNLIMPLIIEYIEIAKKKTG
jgi:CheY-like chemotaxis protein